MKKTSSVTLLVNDTINLDEIKIQRSDAGYIARIAVTRV